MAKHEQTTSHKSSSGLTLRRRVFMGAALALAFAGFEASSLVFATDAAARGAAARERWVGTWSASPMAADSAVDATNAGFDNQTLRQTAHVSVGGDRVRVRLSNAFGTEPLLIGRAHVGRQSDAAAIVPDSDRALTFSGQPSVAIPPGAVVVSDAVELELPALADVAVSLFLPEATGPLTWHQLGVQTTYISPPGDFTGAANLPTLATDQARYILSGVEVMPEERAFALVTLGDSITDGYGSTPDANRRWPDYLSLRVNAPAADAPARAIGILNQGISGNRLLHDIIGPNASARFDRDVLGQTGVTHVIVMIGINDIGFPGAFGLPEQDVSAAEIIAGLQQLVTRAHSRGLRIFGATLTPFEGTPFPGYFTPDGETKRQAVNAWIRSEGSFDGVIDFDAAIRDPAHPTQLLPAYDSGDHLHPNDTGYAEMAEAVDLRLLRP